MTSTTAKKILLVEDEPLIRLVTREILSDAGFEVVEASTADEALPLVDESIAAIITDVELPGTLDGIALAQTVAVKWPAIGIVIVSGRRFPTSDQLPIRARFMPKPYVAERLVDVVAELL